MSETTLNLRGLKCPLPALRTRKALTKLVAGDLLSRGTWLNGVVVGACFVPLLLQYLCASLIGMMIGFAERVSHYRDEPWRAAKLSPGRAFIAVNGAASLFAELVREGASSTVVIGLVSVRVEDGFEVRRFERPFDPGFDALYVRGSDAVTDEIR